MNNNTGKAGRLWRLLVYFFGTALLAELDQITKAVAEAGLYNKPDYDIIKGVLTLSYLRNSGAAWGMLSGKINLFIVITVVVVVAVTYAIINMPSGKRYIPLLISCTVLVAGAVGNFIDRVRFGYVRDFIYFKLIDFPVFNIADCYVTVSVVVLAVLIMFVYDDGDFDFLKLTGNRKDSADE